ncbi:thiol:disulfide interchange protein DsbA/DsbL [Corticibacter populi]|uniref:Thiol:disulfide interchange protein n=1 Tax=Corticibacter populi TaxID=1550736 RepID=A0A3M6QKS5_9BURK|nr:thiol:disulfide interchange protein DsbA/DsbL [Corticibacter populi]RMX03062.1 thiol:disulfide interchange protein DsbA/DsbL [Corticibacter populi]RZS33502.1 thiol:disulfide interchange protein DsbA [Corticibacter populi]
MNRRDFSLSTLLLGSAGALATVPAWAQGAAPQEGKDYIRLSQPVNTNVPQGKLEVLEFFWYSCPHCNSFEPTFANWVKAQPDDVAVRRVPIAFQQNANFVPQQKLYYALEGLGLLDRFHTAAFNAIHRERKRLNSDEAIFDWAKSVGIDVEEFKKTYNSFTVANSVRRATQLQNDFRIEGVPSLGVAGRYYVDGTMAGSLGRMLDVTEQLLAIERQKAG